jgi:NADPH:quinone reductase-like Zn-dependent oxidoreductase
MQAAVAYRYGRLRVDQIAKPELDDPDRVLIRVHAAAINPLDYHEVNGTWFARPATGWLKPKQHRRGVDVSGVVEEVGANVTEFAAGDEVFGSARGSLAEFTRPPAKQIVKKPSFLSFEEAAGIAVAGGTALIAVRDKGQVRAGERVLVNGAAGGVGTFAVQFAKAFGAEVTAVCSTRNVELVRSLGADRVIDYTRDDFSRDGVRYDAVITCVDSRSLRALKRSIGPDGRIVLAGGRIKQFVYAVSLGRFSKKRVIPFLANVTQEHLQTIADLIGDGKVRVVIDRTYPLAEAPEAVRYLAQKHARGKVIVVP